MLAALCCGPSFASAVDIGLTATLSGGRSDNIVRTADNERDEDIYTAGAILTLTEQSQNVMADVQARAMRYRYSSDTFDDETLATFVGQVQFTSTNSLFSWVIQDNYGQQIVDPFRAVTPNNRENVNIFSTGPDFRLPVGQLNSVVLGLRYTDTHYEFRPQDNEILRASVQFVRQSTPTRSIALVVTGDEVKYDDQTVNTDLDRAQAFGRLQVNGERTNLGIDLGWTEIESALTRSEGVLAALTLNRQTSPFGNIAIQAGRRFSEAGDIFTQFQQAGNRGIGRFDGDTTADVANTSDPFELNYAGIGYTINRERTRFGIGGGWREEDYEVRSDLDRTVSNVNANVMRRLTPRFRLQGYVQLSRRDFSGTGQEDDDTEFGILAGWDVGQRLGFELEFNRLERDSNALAGDFTENRVFLTISYRLLLSAANP